MGGEKLKLMLTQSSWAGAGTELGNKKVKQKREVKKVLKKASKKVFKKASKKVKQKRWAKLDKQNS